MTNVVNDAHYAWPERGSECERLLHEVAIGAAILLGAQIVDDTNNALWDAGPGRCWAVINERIRLGHHPSRGEVAIQYLSYRNFSLAWDHKSGTWEVVKL